MDDQQIKMFGEKTEDRKHLLNTSNNYILCGDIVIDEERLRYLSEK